MKLWTPNQSVKNGRFVIQKVLGGGGFGVTYSAVEQRSGKLCAIKTLNPLHQNVECISWYDAVEFCSRLSAKTKRTYRLPSEAESEYACRGGTKTPFHFGETVTTDLANYRGIDWQEFRVSGSYALGSKGIYRKKTTPVGNFGVANGYGLYDMHGNVWEWCTDHWHDNYEEAPTDGAAWLDNENHSPFRLLHGGSWISDPINCRSASRYVTLPVNASYYFGLRVVCGGGAARTP